MRTRIQIERQRLVLLVCLVVAGIGLPAAVSAQGGTNASIIGRVVDESGSVIPGVTVEARSPALQVPSVTAVTDAQGEYRLAELPPGEYRIDYSLQGFQTVSRTARLTRSFVAKIDVSLKIGSVSENLTVTGRAPIVDVTSTTSQTVLLQETLQAIPTSQNSILSVMTQAPSIRTSLDVGGSTTGSLPRMGAFGRVGQGQATIEGILGREESGADPGSYYDFTTYDEVQIQTLANDATSPVPGVVVNVIVKSGGNNFHGGFLTSYETPRLQGNNIDSELADAGVKAGNPLIKRYDVSADLGGRITRDKLWFYTAARRQLNNNAVIGCVKPDGQQCDSPTAMWFLTGKLSYQVGQNHKIVWYDGENHKSFVGGPSTFVPWETRWDQEQPGANRKLEWNGIFGQSLVVKAQYGYWYYNSRKVDFSDNPGTYDIATQKYSGEQFNTYVTPGYNQNWRHDLTGSASLFIKDWIHGNHGVTAGWEYFQEHNSFVTENRPSGNYALYFNNGAPYELLTYNIPVVPLQSLNYGGAYVKDNWSVNRRLSLNLGLRFDHYNMFIPPASRSASTFAPAAEFPLIKFPTWNNLVPRLHVAYDVSGDAKTVVKGGWGRFNEIRQTYSEPNPFNPNAVQSTTYRWHDINGDGNYQTGEANLDPNGLDFLSSSGGTTYVINPDEQSPQFDEFSATIERELVADVAVHASVVYGRGFNNRRLLNTLRPYDAYSIPITRSNPVTPGSTITYYDYPQDLAGLSFQNFMRVNDPSYVNTWKSLELAITKRLSHRWQFEASFSSTKRNMQFAQTGGNPPYPPLTPNAEIFANDNTWEWLGKAAASYELPWGVLASENYQLIAGDPWAKQVLLTGGQQTPSIVVNAEPLGSERMPAIHMLDVRAEKTVPVLRQGKIRLRLDVFNLLNSNAATAVNRRFGPTVGVPTAIVAPRIAAVAAVFSF